MKIAYRMIACVAIVSVTTLHGCSSRESAPSQDHAKSPAESFERGPHRGRLLRDGDYALELQIFEEGVPPEFHVYRYRGDKSLPPANATITVELRRIDGETNRFAFTPEGDFLKGNGVVHEPHSFSVTVTADEGGKAHRWTFDSFEGRVSIPKATAEQAGVRVEVAGPARIADTLVLAGRIVPNPEHVRSVSARFPGLIRTVLRSVGDEVKAGESLATVEGNESLSTYSVTSPLGGTVVERHANPGENAASDPLFVIADYRQLWAELTVFPRDLSRIRTGQRVTLHAGDGALELEGKVGRIAPAEVASGAPSGLYVARVAFSDTARRWTPGLFVEGTVEVSAETVPIAVKRTGLQAFRDFTVVFVQVGDTYEVRMLELGRQDDTWVEIKGGLKPGSSYVTENSYLIKADIEKSGASHDH